MKFNKNNNSFSFSGYTKSKKKCNIPFKSLIKSLPSMQKKSEIFNFWQRFRAIFEKIVFLKNGRSRHETGAMPTYFAFIFHGT